VTRSGGANAMKECSIAAPASSCRVGSAMQMPPRQLAAGIDAAQPLAEAPCWIQLLPDWTIDPQPMLPPGGGAMARRKPSSRRIDPTRRDMMGA
jgi:hypothetical protein